MNTMMKKLLILSILTLVAAAEGGVAGASARLNVTAKLNKDRDRTTSSGKSSSSKTESEIQYYTLDIQVSNTGKSEGTFDISWYFIKRKISGNGEKGMPFSVKGGKETFTIPGQKRINHEVNSEGVIWTATKKGSSGKKKKSGNNKSTVSGEVYDGYVVLAHYEGELLQKNSGDRKYLSDEWLAKLDTPAPKAQPAPKKKSSKKSKKKGKKKK
jgi:hypothetical protein